MATKPSHLVDNGEFKDKDNDNKPNLQCVVKFKGEKIMKELKHMSSTTLIAQEIGCNVNQHAWGLPGPSLRTMALTTALISVSFSV